MKKILPVTLLFIVLIIALVFYNYLSAQKAMREERPSILSVENISYPETLLVKKKASFIWRVQSPADLKTDLTTIYWGYDSSPSALTVLDSPQAVGYPNRITDYDTGEFSLPYTFSATLSFDTPGFVYFRSYAHVAGEHLWSPEQSFNVIYQQ